MNLKHVVILAGAVGLIWACAAQKETVSDPYAKGQGVELFAQAEKLFEAQAYEEALQLYLEYMERYKEEPLAAAALMKIGSIHAVRGDFENARAAYRRILTDYPSSSLEQDAQVESLFTYYQQRRYQDVIQLAPNILRRLDSNLHIFKTYALIGDAYLGLDAPVDAMDNYVRAREYATDLEQDAILGKLKEAIAQLDTADVAILVNHPDDSLPMDFLLYQLGLNYVLEAKYDDALNILDEFIGQYPENENRILVATLIDEIKKNAVYKRNTIGVLLPLTGPYQTFGSRALKGVELALSQFSSQGRNPAINISVKDTAADPDKTVRVMAELYQEQVSAIIGPIVTSEIAAREAQELGIPIITLTQKDKIPHIGDKVFRNFITPNMQVQAIASLMIESFGLYRFAILYPDENYGWKFMNLFWDEIMQLGGQVVGVESYQPKQTDFTDPIKKLVGLYYEIPEDLKIDPRFLNNTDDSESAQNADQNISQNGSEEDQEDAEPKPIIDFDAIFIPDSPGMIGLIVPQLAYIDIRDVYLLGTNLWHSDSLIEIADHYVQGAVIPDGFYAESDSARVRQFVSAFEQTYQEKPDFIEAVVFDSAMMLFQAISRPSVQYRNEIRDELLNLVDFPGVTGMTQFDENGEVQKKLYLLRIKGKRFVELK